MKKILLFILVVCFILAFSGCAAAGANPNNGTKDGVTMVYTAKDTGVADFDKKMDQSKAIMLKRLESLGLSTATVANQGKDKLKVTIPKADNADEVFTVLGKPGKLGFFDPDGALVIPGETVSAVSLKTTNGKVALDFSFDEKGAKNLADATTKLIGQSMSIQVDGVVISSPEVVITLSGGQAEIIPQISEHDAQLIVLQIQSGPLPLIFEKTP